MNILNSLLASRPEIADYPEVFAALEDLQDLILEQRQLLDDVQYEEFISGLLSEVRDVKAVYEEHRE